MDECETWLAAYLTQGPRRAFNVYNSGSRQGFTSDQLRRARRRLGVETFRDEHGGWHWKRA